MALLAALALLLATRIARHLPGTPDAARLVAWSAASTLALGVVATHRYDAVVGLLLCASLWAAFTDRPAVLGVALGLAVATKLTPLLAAPLFAIYFARSRRWRELAIASAGGMVAAGALCIPALALAGSSVLDMGRYHAERPLQIESTGAALLGVAHALFGGALTKVDSYGSVNVLGAGDRWVSGASTVSELAAIALIYLAAWRQSGRAQSNGEAGLVLVRSLCAVLVAFMVFGKVFSPQYLVWLVPLGLLASLASGRSSPWMLLATLALTQAIFPISYGPLSELRWWACALVLVRNGLLATWAARMVA
jgi:hypothetical protein